MHIITHTIADPLGLHAQAAVRLATALASYPGQVTASCQARSGPAKDPLALMALDAVQGDRLTLAFEDGLSPAQEASLQSVLAAL